MPRSNMTNWQARRDLGVVRDHLAEHGDLGVADLLAALKALPPSALEKIALRVRRDAAARHALVERTKTRKGSSQA